MCLNPLYQDREEDGEVLGRVVELHCANGSGNHMLHRKCADLLTQGHGPKYCPYCRGQLKHRTVAGFGKKQFYTPVAKRHAQLKEELAEKQKQHEESKKRRIQRSESLRGRRGAGQRPSTTIYVDQRDQTAQARKKTKKRNKKTEKRDKKTAIYVDRKTT